MVAVTNKERTKVFTASTYIFCNPLIMCSAMHFLLKQETRWKEEREGKASEEKIPGRGDSSCQVSAVPTLAWKSKKVLIVRLSSGFLGPP